MELTATSTAEILVSLLEALGRETNLLDKDVATSLLTGLIYDTSSFQNMNTTPKSLTVAAQLVAAGARQQEIIKNLYKTKSLETLKLWGTVLSNVKEDRMNRFLWSSITKSDIEKVGASEAALTGVIDELLKSATDVDFVILLSEREGQVRGSLRSITRGINVAQIAEEFGGGGHEVAAAFRIDGDLSSKEDEVLTKIRRFQSSAVGPNISTVPEVEEKKPEEKVPAIPTESRDDGKASEGEEKVVDLDSGHQIKTEEVVGEEVEPAKAEETEKPSFGNGNGG